jgi:two-component sensor histidine kinase
LETKYHPDFKIFIDGLIGSTMNRRILRCLTLLYLFFFSIHSYPQGQDTEFDSVKTAVENMADHNDRFKAITDMAWAYSRSDPPRALKYAEWARDLAVRENDQDLIAHVNYYFGSANKNLGNYQEALDYFMVYFDYFTAAGDKQKVCYVYYQMGVCKLLMADYNGALDDFYQNIRLARELGYKDTEANTLNVIATVYSKINDYEKAVALNNEALLIFRELDDKRGQGQCLINNANYYAILEKYDAADSLYHKALELFQAVGDQYMIGSAYFNLGNLVLKQGDLVSSEELHLKSQEIRQELGHQKDLAESHLSLAKVYLKKNEPRKALLQFEKASELAEIVPSLDLKKQLAEGLAKAYESLGEFKESTEMYKKVNTLSDSILNLEITRQIAELNVGYETELKENQIQLLQKDQVIARRNQSLYASAALLFLILGLAAFILYRNRNRNIKKLEEKNSVISKMLEEKEFLIKEIHHRVKNNLQVISSLLQLQSRYVDEPLALAALNEGESRVRSMSIIHHHLYTESNLSHVNVSQYVDNLCNNLLSSYNYKKQDISIIKEVDDIALDVSVMVPLGLIINELITNAFKYAFEGRESGEIQVKINEREGKLFISIKDNGIGMNQLSAKKGFGNRLIETFLKKLEATSETIIDGGSEVRIKLEVYEKAAVRRASA